MAAPYRQVSNDVEVSVEPLFLPEQSSAEQRQFVWAYNIQIVNRGERTVQLLNRHWRITDSFGQVQEVRGPGVIGEQPILRPGDTFVYSSHTVLKTPSGFMVGDYEMSTEAGDRFQVNIPAFSLDEPLTKARAKLN